MSEPIYDACIITVAELQRDVKDLTAQLERMRSDRDYWKDKFHEAAIRSLPGSPKALIQNDAHLRLWIIGFLDPAHSAETRLRELKSLLASPPEATKEGK